MATIIYKYFDQKLSVCFMMTYFNLKFPPENNLRYEMIVILLIKVTVWQRSLRYKRAQNTSLDEGVSL